MSESSVDLQRSTLRYVPADTTLNKYRCENFKCYKRHWLEGTGMNEEIEKLNKCTQVSPSSEFLNTVRAFTEPETPLRIESSQQASIGPQSLSLR